MARKACVHPLAAVFYDDPLENTRLLCKLCKSAVELPPDMRPPRPSRTLVRSVASFLKYVTDIGDSGAQMNPRTELALILAMSDALHALKYKGGEGGETGDDFEKF